MHDYDALSRIWDNNRKIKGNVALRSKRYLRKNGDVFELWARKPDDNGVLVAVVDKTTITAVNVDKYTNHHMSLWQWFGINVYSIPAAKAAVRNYSKLMHVYGMGCFPLTEGSGFDFIRDVPVKGVYPLQLKTSALTEKKIKARAKEWRAVMLTITSLLKTEMDRSYGRIPDSELPTIDGEVNGGTALKLLENSRARTSTHIWERGRESTDLHGNRVWLWGYVERPNFTKNLITKALNQLRNKWRREATDSVWLPVEARA